MIKLQKHRLVCDCDDCAAMFPPDRFEVTWAMPAPDDAGGRDGSPASGVGGGLYERVVGRVPLGAARAAWSFVVWVDADQRLAGDWPGFPGTRGARVELARTGLGNEREVTGTHDPALAALAEPVPLRRLAVERINARCMVEYGLAPDDVAEFVACDVHGEGGIGALACVHAAEGERADVVVVYGVDGDYPDLFCAPCLARFTRGEVEVALRVCSRCQQANLYRHRLVARTWYGASTDGDPS